MSGLKPSEIEAASMAIIDGLLLTGAWTPARAGRR